MRVYAIYGESGTGKSTSALAYAHEHNIQAIVDDGLLIKDGRKVAGTSAKFEKNALTAVKRAIFQDVEHREEVIQALQENEIGSLLIIGTSIKMVNKIAFALKIPEIHEYTSIDSIRTEEEISLAKFIRDIQGKHTMPLPKHEVNQSFFQRMIQKGRDIFTAKKEKIGETTIVSPDFHQPTIFIESEVYKQIIEHAVLKADVVKTISKINFKITDHEAVIELDIIIKAPVTYSVIEEVRLIQQMIQRDFLMTFNLMISTIKINIKLIQT